MEKEQIYAVVDLEATGSSINSEHKIIQFGCSLVQNNEIIQEICFNINPLRSIPERITTLTGIRQQDVQEAPIFEDVAPLILSLLEDCIFVAHNVNFDYRFLNKELNAAGYESLSLLCIDTVELSQILYPQMESYSLSDLSEYFDLGLGDNHHDAGADASATAKLLLQLDEKAELLPQVTLFEIAGKTKHLHFESWQFFDSLAQTKTDETLSDQLVIVNDMAIRTITEAKPWNYREVFTYPKTDEDKRRLLSKRFESRRSQYDLMDEIHNYLEGDEERFLAIESPAGSGKTLAYLTPLVYESLNKRPVIISTNTHILQDQLINENIPLMEEILGEELPMAVLKSRRHYLDIEAFNKSRFERWDHSGIINICKVLVWLTETQTGDLNEILRAKDRHDFWDAVRTYKQADFLEESSWAPYQYYLISRRKAEHARVIVTNHAYLSHQILNKNNIFPKNGVYIFDEAHHLPRIGEDLLTASFSFKRLYRFIKSTYLNENYDTEFRVLEKLFKGRGEAVGRLRREMDNLAQSILINYEQWIEEYCLYDFKDEGYIMEFRLEERSLELQENTKKLLQEMQAMVISIHTLYQYLFKDFKSIPKNNQAEVYLFYNLKERFTEEVNQFYQIIFSAQQSDRATSWLEIPQQQNWTELGMKAYQLQDHHELQEAFHRLSKAIFISGTLQTNGENNTILDDFLGENFIFSRYPSPFALEKQAQVVTFSDLPKIKEINSFEYAQIVGDNILQFAEAFPEERMLILFNSYQSLNDVYAYLRSSSFFDGRTLLVQGKHGSRHRLLKNFNRLPGSILLGAGAFWEGIDLPGEALRILVMTRLPFAFPNDTHAKVRAKYWLEKGENPFYRDTLPSALIRFKQGFGRLIRQKDDKGILFILDRRVIDSKYASHFKKALPEGIEIQDMEPSQENFDKLQKFLKE